MTENYICNNIEITYCDREVKYGSNDPTNGFHHILLSITRETKNNRSTYFMIKTTYDQYDYPTIQPQDMKATTIFTELRNQDSIEQVIGDIVKELFKYGVKKVKICYISPSSGESHVQVLVPDSNLTWTYSGLCMNTGDLPLQSTIKQYAEFIQSLFTSDNIKSAIDGLNGLSRTITDLFGQMKK